LHCVDQAILAAIQGADISVMKIPAGCLVVLLAAAPMTAQRAPAAAAPPLAPSERTLDQYCVTCHNDRLKTSNLSLEKLDLPTAGDHAELWEKVIRKLRAGVMPPPGVSGRRSRIRGPQDWLEAEIDRKAASHASTPGPSSFIVSIDGYANVIRDLARSRHRRHHAAAARRRGERV
jgi:cytochrome c5